MKIRTVEDCTYYLDGGSISLAFTCVDGCKHSLWLGQRLFFVRKGNGPIALDGRVVTNDKAILRDLEEAIGSFLSEDNRVEGTQEFPKDLIGLGDERLMLKLARERLQKKLQGGQPDPDYDSWQRFEEERARRNRRTPEQQDQDDFQFYHGLGPEYVARPCKKEGCPGGAVRHSVLCRKHHFEQVRQRACPFDH